MKYLSLLLLLASFQTQAFLDPKDRPQGMQDDIEASFQKLACQEESIWRNNGDLPGYFLCHVPDEKLIPSVIANAPADQKEFYFLDIGAGKFGWGQNTVEILQGIDLGGKTAHVISVRGEQNKDPEKKTLGNIHIYELGAVKVEDISNVLQQRLDFDCLDKLDLIVSSWTSRHLVDPLGTLVYSYNLLRPGTGKMFFNSFFFAVAEEDEKETDETTPLFLLLHQAKIPFLACQCKYSCKMWSGEPAYILSRPSPKPMELPLRYKGVIPCHKDQVESKKMVAFTLTAPWEQLRSGGTYDAEKHLLGNDADLFKWFQTVEYVDSWNPTWAKKLFDITSPHPIAEA